MKYFLASLFLLTSCAKTVSIEIPNAPTASDLDILKAQVTALIGTQNQIDTLVNSDFKTCSGTGDTSDALIKKICNVAQAANAEALADLKGQLAAYSDALSQQLILLSNDLATATVNVDAATASIVTINATLVSIQTNVTNLQSAVTTLQGQVASITGTLATNLIALTIGDENVSAGPLYETLLKRFDNTRVNGYVEATSAAVAITNGGYAATSGSSTITVTTSAAHGLVAGNLVRMTGGTIGKGFLSLDITGDFAVVSAPTTTTFTYVAYRNATSSGTFGSSGASAAKYSGHGLGTLWTSSQVSDIAVRQTSLGSKTYNFIIRRLVDITKCEVCYSKSDNVATFGTINAAPVGGNATIACK